jgi:putative zinc finger/helix-turn-helix YgiT family protein
MYCSKCKKEMKETIGSHHYTECGLDNVTLHNIEMYECTKCGKTIPIIIHIDELHRVLANKLTTKEERLKGKELRFVRKLMGLKAVDLAEALGVTPQSVSQWENDKSRIGTANDRLIKFIYRRNLYRDLRALSFRTVVQPQLNLDFQTFLDSITTPGLVEAAC